MVQFNIRSIPASAQTPLRMQLLGITPPTSLLPDRPLLHLKLIELLDLLASTRQHAQNIESDLQNKRLAHLRFQPHARVNLQSCSAADTAPR